MATIGSWAPPVKTPSLAPAATTTSSARALRIVCTATPATIRYTGRGGKGDRLQGGLGQDKLFGQEGNDFANAIDGQTNDFVDCGRGAKDVAAIDVTENDFDNFARNCERVYIGVGPFPLRSAAHSGTDLSSIDTLEEAEQAEADGLLKQIR